MINAIVAYLCLVAAMSGICYGAYWFDKRCAVIGARRVPEKTLHAMALLGGWPGAMLAQQKFRHKTHKPSFRITFWATVVAHVGIVVLLAFGVIDLTTFKVGSRVE
jgi:uncharacterized membrane protein YsdA (DUF1294 family)